MVRRKSQLVFKYCIELRQLTRSPTSVVSPIQLLLLLWSYSSSFILVSLCKCPFPFHFCTMNYEENYILLLLPLCHFMYLYVHSLSDHLSIARSNHLATSVQRCISRVAQMGAPADAECHHVRHQRQGRIHSQAQWQKLGPLAARWQSAWGTGDR